MPLTPVAPSPASIAEAAKSTLLELFAELARVSQDADSDASSLLRQNELVALVATRLTSEDAVLALESDAARLSSASNHQFEPSSIAFNVLEALSSRTATPLRLIAIDQLAIFFSLSIDTSRRERASDALLRLGVARALVDECLSDSEHIDVSQAAIRLLLRWGGDPSERVAAAFFNISDANSVTARLAAQRDTPCSDVVLMRFHELTVMLYTRSEFAARRCDANPLTASLLDAMAATLSSDDILLKLNVVELICQLCTSVEGVQYCERRGILQQFVDAVGNEPEDPFARMYTTLVVKCVGRFAPLDVYDGVGAGVNRHAVLTQLSALLARASDQDLLTEACTALASLMANIDSAYAVLLTNTVHHFVLPLIPVHNRVLGTAALYAFGTLVRRLDEDTSKSFVDLCTLDDDAFLLMLRTRVLRNNENSKTPLRVAAFACAQAIAGKVWGTAALVNDADWFELLVSRDSELNMAGWHAKYDLVRAIEEQLVRARIGEPKSSTIAAYLRQGAVFTRVEPRPEVAMKS